MITREMGIRILVASSALAFASAALGQTTVNPAPAGEDNLITILGKAYGYTGASTGTIGTTVGYTSGANSISFARIPDTGGAAGLLPLNGSILSRNDTNWQDGTPTFAIEAKFASYNQVFGWKNVAGGGTNQDLISITGNGYSPTVTTLASPSALSSNFLWYDQEQTTFNRWFSDPSANALDTSDDHMVTFFVTGKTAGGSLINGGLGAYVLAFEDLRFTFPSDKDYNDLVLQVAAVPGTGTPRPVPLPSAVWAGLSVLGVLGGARLLSRRRAH